MNADLFPATFSLADGAPAVTELFQFLFSAILDEGGGFFFASSRARFLLPLSQAESRRTSLPSIPGDIQLTDTGLLIGRQALLFLFCYQLFDERYSHFPAHGHIRLSRAGRWSSCPAPLTSSHRDPMAQAIDIPTVYFVRNRSRGKANGPHKQLNRTVCLFCLL